MDGLFATAGAEAVVEEFMEGEEALRSSCCAMATACWRCRGAGPQARFRWRQGAEHRRHGRHSPAPVFTDVVRERTMSEIILPTLRAMKASGCPIRGCCSLV